jgi:hypothetical protein
LLENIYAFCESIKSTPVRVLYGYAQGVLSL